MSLHKTNGFFSLVSSEQTLIDSLLGLLDSNGKGQNNNNEITLNGFDGAASGTLRNCRNAYVGRSYGAVVLFAQSGSIEKVLNASGGTGVSERFLFISEQHYFGVRKHVNAPIIDRSVTDEYSQLSKEIARLALNKNPEISYLTIKKSGHLKIKQYRDKIEHHLADGGRYAVHMSLRGSAAKVDMQIMKIAANLHLLDGGAYQSEIDDRHITSAICIVNDLLEAALGLCHDKGIVGAKAEFETIIGYLSNSKRAKGATWREITNSLKSTQPFKNMTSGRNAAIKSAVDEMTSQGLIVAVNGVYSIG